MSDHAYTSTRVMAQSAAQKAQDAYAVARKAMSAVEASTERLPGELELAELARRVGLLEYRQAGIDKLAATILAQLEVMKNAPPRRKPGRPRKLQENAL